MIMEQTTIQSGIIMIIILLTFILIFSGTKLTIKVASELCYSWILLFLIISQLVFLYGILDKNNLNKNNHKQIYILEISGLISIALVYILYIKRIYDIEKRIVEDLKEKNII
jgi:amino acid permease